MNHLEQLKQKMMVKPDVQERERVAVVIKGEKKTRKHKVQTEKKSVVDELEEGVLDLGEQISEIQEIQGILPTKVAFEEKEELVKKQTEHPIIVDKRQQGYDRAALLKKLAENKK
jgi:hypothetical protein